LRSEGAALVHPLRLDSSLQLIALDGSFVDNRSLALFPPLNRRELELVAVKLAVLDVSRAALSAGRRFDRARQRATVAFQVEGVLNGALSKLRFAGPLSIDAGGECRQRGSAQNYCRDCKLPHLDKFLLAIKTLANPKS